MNTKNKWKLIPGIIFIEVIMLSNAAIEAIKTKKGASPVTIITKTVPDMRKTDNPYYGDVIKISRVNCIINWIYANAIKKVDPNFVPQPRKWGTRKGPFVEYTNNRGEQKLYLETKVERVLETVFVRLSTDTIIPNVELEPYLKKTQETNVILRDYDINNIVTLVMDKKNYYDEVH